MSSYYHINELSGGLRIRSRRDIAIWERLLGAGFAGVAAALATSTFFTIWWCAFFSSGIALLVFVAVRGLNAELRATGVEFVTKGHLGRRGPTNRIVCTGDVRGLEFQDPRGQLRGLYAVTARRDHCILPFLDYGQTMEVIQAIESKFPGLAEQWRGNSASGGRALLSRSLGGLL
jgi:hypothetical protein